MNGCYLTPSFPMSDFALVLQMGDHLCLSGKSPNQTSTIRSWILFRRPHVHPRFVYIRRSLVHRADQQFYKSIHLRFVLVMVGQLERVIKEYVS